MGSTIQVRRGQRQYRALPSGELKIPNFPGVPSPPRKPSLLILLAPTGAMLILSLIIGFITNSPSTGTFLLISGPAMSLVAFLRYRQHKKEVEEETERILSAYNNRLRQVLKIAQDFHDQQREAMNWRYPASSDLIKAARDRSDRLWERRPGDSDFLDLRLGTSTAAPNYILRLPIIDIPELTPQPVLDAHRLAEPFLKLDQAAFGWSFDQYGSLAIVGDLESRNALARALVAQLACLHSPNEARLWALYHPAEAERWEWLKWLPHCGVIPGTAARHQLAYEPGDVQTLLSAMMDELEARQIKLDAHQPLDEPHLVLLATDAGLIAGKPLLDKLLNHKDLKASLLLLAADPSRLPSGFNGWVEIDDHYQAHLHQGVDHSNRYFKPDALSWRTAEGLARSLAPLTLVDSSMDALPDEVRLSDLLGVSSIEELDLSHRWLTALDHPPSLKATLGLRSGGRPLVIDLKQSGHGPHGLIAGTTGSGKSELLLTLLSGLAMEHHPHQVNFVLMDYKGGTAMSVLAYLPHTLGLVTDLDGRQTRRALAALRSEMSRREEILARHQVADIDKYHQQGYKEPFPYLFVVIDEFAELRQHFNDDLTNILNQFISVAQKGRALGVHLILSMQKPEGVVNDSIRANMKFRICLRVERTEDSRNVLGRSDAFLLPHQPVGRAYFQVGNQQFDLFQVARVAGPPGTATGDFPDSNQTIFEVGPNGQRTPLIELSDGTQGEGVPDSTPNMTEARILAAMAKETGKKLQIEQLPSPWPPPLPASVPLDELFSRLRLPGWQNDHWRRLDQEPDSGIRPAPIALLDLPHQQLQTPLQLDLDKVNSLIVIGAPGSGKTMSLLSTVVSLARRHRPDELHLHVLAFGGHQLRVGLTDFPHVAGIYGAEDHERIHRLLASLSQKLDCRRQLFAQHQVADLRGFRRVSKEENGDDMAAIVVVIDNVSGFLERMIDESEGWIRLLREGGAYGIYFLLASDRMPPNRVSDLINLRIALRLTDSTWYSVLLGGRPDLDMYEPTPGGGFLAGKPPTALQMALAYDGQPEKILERVSQLGQKMAAAWSGPAPEPIQILPERVELDQMFSTAEIENSVDRIGLVAAMGLEYETFEPLVFDLIRYGSTFLVSGPPESGKSTSLMTLVLSIAHRYDPASVELVFIAANRSQVLVWETLAELPQCQTCLQTEDEFNHWLEAFEQETQTHDDSQQRKLTLMIMDDQPMWAGRVSTQTVNRLEGVIRRGGILGFTLAASAPSTSLNAIDGVLRTLKTGRTGLWLNATDAPEAASVGLRLTRSTLPISLPPGRGYLYHPAGFNLVQMACPMHLSANGRSISIEQVKTWVDRIQTRWR